MQIYLFEFSPCLPCSLSLDTGTGFGTGSEDFKLAKLFADFATLAVDALVAEEARSLLRDIVALRIFRLLILLLTEPSLRSILLLWSLPEVDDVVTDPTLVLVDILLAFSLLSEFFAIVLALRLSGSQTDLDRTVPKCSLLLTAVGALRNCLLLLASSSLSLVEEGRELNEESTIGSTLEILSHLFRTGSVPSESFTFSNEDIIGNKIGGSRKSLLVEVDCEASVS